MAFQIDMEMRLDRCELCSFAEPESRYMNLPRPLGSMESGLTRVEILICKRMPPTPDDQGYGVWPIVSRGCHCGEFKGSNAGKEL